MAPANVPPARSALRSLAARACAAILVLLGGCTVSKNKPPTGFLGATWGDDPAQTAKNLDLHCDRWDPWIDPTFETSIDFDHPKTALGVPGLIRLIRGAGKRLAGIQVIYRDCARDDARKHALRQALHAELHVKTVDVDVPYQVWADDSLVHLIADPSDGTCTLTVAGPAFGAAFKLAQLRSGLGSAGAAIGPK